ncbi:MAG: hypothetical protein LPL29_12565 [Alphaproteobacteria bacterium]|nr:hypothetical protein [Alphaproteobacteria bacterium]MDX5416447.1 hypothetical protein [Alphaproteobacteria bacterium]
MQRDGMNQDRFAYFRWLICGPFVAVVLALFALYFTGRRKWGLDRRPVEWIWAALVGLPMAVANIVLLNMILATFIFLRPPVWQNTRGEFSPFFTTRIKAYRREGSPLADHIAQVVNTWDEGHF